MGVNPVGNTQKYFTFDGESSKDYKTHISGTGVFDAPVRNVEMITIPGRNGAYALDNGNFDNVELTYEASIVADSVAEFSAAVSDLRNWLCSKKGYHRLEDDYNPNEYRMACYRSGLEVEPFLATSGTFEIVFDCKPQRFLTSGETAASVTNGGIVTNPTKFEAHPMFEVNGYGSIAVNGSPFTIGGGSIGLVKVSENAVFSSSTGSATFQTQYANSGNEIKIKSNWGCGGQSWLEFDETDFEGAYVESETGGSVGYDWAGGNRMWVSASLDRNNTYYYGTASSHTVTGNIDLYYDDGNGGFITKRIVYGSTLSYDGGNTFTITISITLPQGFSVLGHRCNIAPLQINSTQSALGNPLYVDLETGEAYKVEGGVPVSVNNDVVLPNELPTLNPGNNIINYSNTVADLKVVPRWWQV